MQMGSSLNSGPTPFQRVWKTVVDGPGAWVPVIPMVHSEEGSGSWLESSLLALADATSWRMNQTEVFLSLSFFVTLPFK